MSESDDRFDWVRSRVVGITGKILDIGCNEGMMFSQYPNASQVTGVDIDAWDPPNYARFVQADASSLPFADNEFECAIISEVLEHVPDPVLVLKEASRVAKLIIFTVPNEYGWSKNAEPFQSKESIRAKGDEPFKFTLSNKYCRGMVDNNTKPHLFHVRYFTKEILEETLKKAGLKFSIETLEYDIRSGHHFAYFVGTAERRGGS